MIRNLPTQFYFNGGASFNRQDFVNDQLLLYKPDKGEHYDFPYLGDNIFTDGNEERKLVHDINIENEWIKIHKGGVVYSYNGSHAVNICATYNDISRNKVFD